MLDVLRTEKELAFRAKTSFEEELRKTIEWYISTRRLNRFPPQHSCYVSYAGKTRETYNFMDVPKIRFP